MNSNKLRNLQELCKLTKDQTEELKKQLEIEEEQDRLQDKAQQKQKQQQQQRSQALQAFAGAMSTISKQGVNGASAIAALGRGIETIAPSFSPAVSMITQFTEQAYASGEAFRKAQFEIQQLSRISVDALSDSDLSANMQGLANMFEQFGVDAGNQFKKGFGSTSLGKGLYNTGYDAGATLLNTLGSALNAMGISNTFGDTKSAEQKEATKKGGLVDMYNKAQAESQARIAFESDQSAQSQAVDIQEQLLRGQVLAGHYDPNGTNNNLFDASGIASNLKSGGNPISPDDMVSLMTGKGVSPGSYGAREREIDISDQAMMLRGGVNADQQRYDMTRYAGMSAAPAPLNAQTGLADEAKKQRELLELRTKINNEASKGLQLSNQEYQLAVDKKNIEVERVRNQNYGKWRSAGLGGYGIGDDAAVRMLGHRTDSGGSAGFGGSLGIGGGNLFAQQQFASTLSQRVNGSGFGSQADTARDTMGVLKSIDKSITTIGVPTIKS